MDEIDRKISSLVQADGRASSADIAGAVGVSLSTANERLRRLVASGVIRQWRGVLDPQRAGAGLCAYVFLDVGYDGEEALCQMLRDQPEVQELHHISGPHSYLMKLRLRDTEALQAFLQDVVKPQAAVQRTETILSLSTLKETTVVKVMPPSGD